MMNENVSAILNETFADRETIEPWGYTVDIVRVGKIEDNAIEVFAKAWDKDGQQFGFGEKGDIEIERFKIYNLRNKKDAKAALLQEIGHTLSVKKQKFTGTNIKLGTVGNTTSTFYSNASDSVFGFGNVSSWSSARTTYWFMDNDDAFESSLVQKQNDGDWAIYRIGVSFDTSSIGSDTISSATVSFAAERADHNNFNDGLDYWALCDFSPASHTSYVSGDGDNTTFTEQHDSSERIDFSSITVSGYNDYSLNSTGIGNINKSGYTGFMILEGHDIQDSEPAGASSGELNRITIYLSEQSGTTYDPKLVVEHAAGGGVVQPQFLGYAGL